MSFTTSRYVGDLHFLLTTPDSLDCGAIRGLLGWLEGIGYLWAGVRYKVLYSAKKIEEQRQQERERENYPQNIFRER